MCILWQNYEETQASDYYNIQDRGYILERERFQILGASEVIYKVPFPNLGSYKCVYFIILIELCILFVPHFRLNYFLIAWTREEIHRWH